MRKLASVVEIATCSPIPNADRLSVATMKGKGWNVVTGRDEFKPGDIAVYFEIDSYLPADDERYSFFRERCLRKFVSKSGQILREGIRIKTCKLRGVVSQGLLMPISSFPEITPEALAAINPDVEVLDFQHCVGTDLTSLLRVEHYDEIKAALAPQTSVSIPSDAKLADFPTDFIPKTDEERIQNLADYFETMKGRSFEITEKRDGSSVTMFYSPTIDPENPFGVCSRNMRLKPVTDKGAVPRPWEMAAKIGAEEKIRRACEKLDMELAFQGELQGPGIQSNPDVLSDFQWDVFKIWSIKTQRYLLPSEAARMCEMVGFNYVPVIDPDCSVFDRFHTIDELLKFAEGKTSKGNEREGLVFKTNEYPYRSFKAVSNKYLLGEKD